MDSRKMSHLCFSHNGVDTIYHQTSAKSIKLALFVVSKWFQTPSEATTETMQFIVDKLNEQDAKAETPPEVLQPEPERQYAFEVGQHVQIHAGCYDGENGVILSRSYAKGKNFYDLQVITGQWVSIKPQTILFQGDLKPE